MQHAEQRRQTREGRGGNLHGKRLALRPHTHREGVVDVLTMLHRADGGPRPVNLGLALYVDELHAGGSTIFFGHSEWVSVSESVDEVMELAREGAQELTGAVR